MRSKVEVVGSGDSKEDVWLDRERIAPEDMSAARKGQKGQDPTLNGMRNHASLSDMGTKQNERQVYPRTNDMVKLQNERHADGCSQGTWEERRMVDVKKKKKKKKTVP